MKTARGKKGVEAAALISRHAYCATAKSRVKYKEVIYSFYIWIRGDLNHL